MLSHHITIESFTHEKTLYKSAWSAYSLTMSTPLKIHYVMAIQKLSMKFIQCDYIIYNIVVLIPFSS
jgi:hypothetical protein